MRRVPSGRSAMRWTIGARMYAIRPANTNGKSTARPMYATTSANSGNAHRLKKFRTGPPAPISVVARRRIGPVGPVPPGSLGPVGVPSGGSVGVIVQSGDRLLLPRIPDHAPENQPPTRPSSDLRVRALT